MIGFDSPIRSFVRLVVYLSWTLVAIPVQMIALVLRTPFRVRFPMIYHRTCLRIVGIDVQIRGVKSKDHPVPISAVD